MANQLPGVGTTLGIKISSSFVTIPLVFEIEGPDIKVGERKLTVLASTSHDSRPGLPDWGMVKVKMFFDPNDTTHILIRDRAVTPNGTTLDEFKKTFVDGDSTAALEDFKGWIKSFKQTGFKEDGTVEAEFEIQVVSQYTRTAGTP